MNEQMIKVLDKFTLIYVIVLLFFIIGYQSFLSFFSFKGRRIDFIHMAGELDPDWVRGILVVPLAFGVMFLLSNGKAKVPLAYLQIAVLVSTILFVLWGFLFT